MKICLLLLTLFLAIPASAATIPLQDVEVSFVFQDNSNSATDQEDEFRVYRCAGRDCIPTVQILTLPRNTTTFTDKILGDVGGASYTYGVSAFNAKGESDKALVTIITPAILVVPGAPSGLIATVVGVQIK